jgi:hypothetical protein
VNLPPGCDIAEASHYSDLTSSPAGGSLTGTEPAPPTTLTLFAQPDIAIHASKVRGRSVRAA